MSFSNCRLRSKYPLGSNLLSSQLRQVMVAGSRGLSQSLAIWPSSPQLLDWHVSEAHNKNRQNFHIPAGTITATIAALSRTVAREVAHLTALAAFDIGRRTRFRAISSTVARTATVAASILEVGLANVSCTAKASRCAHLVDTSLSAIAPVVAGFSTVEALAYGYSRHNCPVS